MAIIQGPKGSSTSAPQQHSQPSRKGKKAWRKNVDVSEVQKGLEQVNEEIIKGGVVAEKESADLFTLDVKGDAAIAKRAPKSKALKADEIIAARSALPAVSLRKRPSKTTDGVLPAKRQRTGYITHKELTRIKKVADGQHDSIVSVVDATYDVWDAPAPTESRVLKAGDEELTFLPTVQSKKAPETIRQEPISLAANGKRIPAVPKPAGGYSYNPLFEDYEERFREMGAKEVEAEQKRLDAAAAERAKQEAAARSAAEAEAAEARADMSEWEEDSAWEGFESGAEDGGSGRAKRPERKTPAERNRAKRRKEAERLVKHQAAMRRKEEQAKRIRDIARQVAERERQLALARDELSDGESEGNDVELRRRQLGKFKIPDKELELVLPDELQDSLRRLKPEGNLLKDRYRSFLVRGKVEARRKIPYHRQAKRKATEKWTHKDFHLF